MKKSGTLVEKTDKLTSEEEISVKKRRSSQEDVSEFAKFAIKNLQIKEAREIIRKNEKTIVKY